MRGLVTGAVPLAPSPRPSPRGERGLGRVVSRRTRLMKLSTDRILTTHVGSLPRPKPLFELIMAKEQGGAVDQRSFEAESARAVDETVAQQRMRSGPRPWASG